MKISINIKNKNKEDKEYELNKEGKRVPSYNDKNEDSDIQITIEDNK